MFQSLASLKQQVMIGIRSNTHLSARIHVDSPPESPLEPLTQAVTSFGDPRYEHRREKRPIASNVQKRMKLAVFGKKQDYRDPDSPANDKS